MKVLVVAQHDVEARLVLLDELVLEEQRLLLGVRQQHLEVAEDVVEDLHESARVGLREVRPHTGPEVHRLADVDDLAGLVPHEVAAGRRRQLGDLLLERGVHGG
jgi:hypothetical protein